MAVQDLWYTKKKDENGNYIKSKSYKKCKRYRVTWSEGDKYPSESFHTMAEAKVKEASVRVDKAAGRFVSKKAGETTFRAYAEEWLRLHGGRTLTKDRLERNLRLHVVEFFGDRQLKDIGQGDILDWKIKLSESLATSSAELVFGVGAAIFKAAVVGKKLPESPFEGVEPPKPLEMDVEPLPTELVEALIDAVPARYRALIVLGAAAGLRLGEAVGLETSHVAFLHRSGPTLHVYQQLMVKTGRPLFIAPPKTAKSRRNVPMSEILAKALALHSEEFPAREMAMEDDLSGKTISRTARLLFTGPRGNPLWRQQVADVIREARATAFETYRSATTTPLERADAEAQIARHADLTFRDLRHFYASLLISQGATVHEVQVALGHSKPTQTLNTYGHLWPGSGDRTRGAVDAVLGRQRRHLRVVA